MALSRTPHAGRRRALAIGLAVGTVTSLAACGGAASDESGSTTLRFANVLPPDDAISETIDWWMEDAAERSDDAVKFDHKYSGALIAGAEMYAGLGDGRAQGGMIVPGYHPAELPLVNISQVPVPYDAETRAKALQKLIEENETVAAEFGEAGITPMFVTMVAAPWGYATKEKVDSLDDMKGQRVRMLPNMAPAYQTFGVEPVFISSEEVYESIERGVIDGATQPFDAWHSTGVYEVAPHMVIHGIGAFGAGVVAMNTAAYEELDEDTRAALEEAAEASYAESSAIFATREAKACDEVLESGGSVTSLSDSEIAEFEDAMGTELVDLWYDAAEKAGHDRVEAEAIWDEFNQHLEEFAPDSTYESGLEACAAR